MSLSTAVNDELPEHDLNAYTPYTVSSMLKNLPENTRLDKNFVPLTQKQQNVDYLFVDEAKRRGEKSWSEKLCYQTGTFYGLGLFSGGIWGLVEGVRNPAGDASSKLRINSILNGCTLRGPLLGNTAGISSLFYITFSHLMEQTRGTDDLLNDAVGGAMAGGLIRSTAGFKAAGRTAVLFAGLAIVVSGGLRLLHFK